MYTCQSPADDDLVETNSRIPADDDLVETWKNQNIYFFKAIANPK